MTASPEYRYRCDRCRDEINVAMDASAVGSRTKGPDDWTMLVIGGDPSIPARHLCPTCTEMFVHFMNGGQASHAKKATGAPHE